MIEVKITRNTKANGRFVSAAETVTVDPDTAESLVAAGLAELTSTAAPAVEDKASKEKFEPPKKGKKRGK